MCSAELAGVPKIIAPEAPEAIVSCGRMMQRGR